MENFSIGEIIWAKIRGYPWWPAQVILIFYLKIIQNIKTDNCDFRRQ